MAEYIGREAAKESFLNMDAGSRAPCSTLLTPEEFAEYLDEIPAADVATVVHGMWVSWEEADNFIPSAHRHECSVCHDTAQVLENNIELLSDFCPNCGAKMDGGVDNG